MFLLPQNPKKGKKMTKSWETELRESLEKETESLKETIKINRYPTDTGTCTYFLTCFTQAKRRGLDVSEAEALLEANPWIQEESLVECDWFKPFRRLKLEGLTESQKMMLLLQADEHLCVLEFLTKSINLRENWVEGLIRGLPSNLTLSKENGGKVQHMIQEGPINGPFLEWLQAQI